MSSLSPIVRAAGEGDRQLFLGGGLHTWKLMSQDTGGTFFLFEDTMAQGKCTPLHHHPEADETLYVIEGEIVVDVDGTKHVVGAGGVTFTPRGVHHALLARSETARVLTLQTPGIGQAFYQGASEPSIDETVDAVDIDRVRASAQANPRGIALLGPPPFDDVSST